MNDDKKLASIPCYAQGCSLFSAFQGVPCLYSSSSSRTLRAPPPGFLMWVTFLGLIAFHTINVSLALMEMCTWGNHPGRQSLEQQVAFTQINESQTM